MTEPEFAENPDFVEKFCIASKKSQPLVACCMNKRSATSMMQSQVAAE